MTFINQFNSPFHLDILKEIGNIGAGNASTALSQLIAEPIEMKVPSARVLPLNDLTDLVGGSETIVAAVFLRTAGDVPGYMFFLFPVTEVANLLKKVTGESRLSKEPLRFSDMGLSAFQEIGNILAGAYLASFSDFTKLDLQPTPPEANIDMAGAIINYGIIELSQASDHVIVIETSFFEKSKRETTPIKGYFLFLPHPESFVKIFAALGAPLPHE